MSLKFLGQLQFLPKRREYWVGMLSIGGSAPAQMERHTANWGLYEETARANGHMPNRKDWCVVGFFHIAETREQARKNVEFGVPTFANYFRDIAILPIIPPDVGDPTEWLIETGTACIGTPDDAVAYIERLIEGSGGFGVLCELAQNWADRDATKKHYELMAAAPICGRQMRVSRSPSAATGRSPIR